jgi:hypothetical protein
MYLLTANTSTKVRGFLGWHKLTRYPSSILASQNMATKTCHLSVCPFLGVCAGIYALF